MNPRLRQRIGMAIVILLFAVLWAALLMNAKP
jgi:hypothetical protein